MKQRTIRGFIAKVIVICMLLSLVPVDATIAEASTTPQLQLTVGGQNSNSVTTEEDAGVWIEASYTDATYTDTVATWEVDDASVVEITEKTDKGCQIRCLKTGNATVTATTANGLTATMGVTVTPIAATAVTEGSNAVNVVQNQNTYISFTPNDDGDYLFVSSGCSVQAVANLERFWSDAGNGEVFALKANNTYKFRICSDINATETITVSKVTNYSSKIILQDWEKEVREFVGHNTSYGYEIEAGTIDYIRATTADPSVVKVSSDGHFVLYEPVGPGETTVTLTTKGGGSAVIDVTVYDVVNGGALTSAAQDVKLLKNKGTEFTFTAPQAGEYWVYFSREIPVVDHAIWGAEHIFEYTSSEWHGIVWSMEKDQELTMVLRAEEGDIDTQVGVQAVDYADDIMVNGGNDVNGTVGTSIKIPVEAIGGNVFRNLSVSATGETADGDPIVWVDDGNPNMDEIEVWLRNAGTATLTVTLDGNITKTIDINVAAYSSSVLKYWSGTQNHGTTVSLEFTPTTSDWYYLHYNDDTFYGNRFEVSEDTSVTAIPGKSFEYSRNGYSGKVYWLEAGEKYVFESYSDETRNYEVYIDGIQVATGFTLDTPTLSGDIDQQVELKISHAGVLVFEEIVSTNKEVVVAGSWSYDETGHTYNVFLLGQGTADLIITDLHGNTQTCTVTVSGNRLPTQVFTDNGDHAAWDEMGLASGESVTYTFTPDTTEYYWIFSELNKDLGIVVTDPSNNNNVVTGKPWIARESNGKNGYIYYLTGGNTYYVTFSSAEAMSTFIVADRMYEATGLDDFGGQEEYWGEVGGTEKIYYSLMDEVNHYSWDFLFAEIEAESSNTDVVEITSIENNLVELSFVGGGEAIVTIKMFGETYTSTVHVSSPATGIEINGGNALVGEAGTVVEFPFAPIGGNDICNMNASTDWGDVARVNNIDWEKGTIEIAFGTELGETTLFVWADSFEPIEFTITNTEYGVSLPKWEGTAEAGEPMIKTFTPAEDGGWYFVHYYAWSDGYEFYPTNVDGEEEIPSFWYCMGDYEGKVYYLTEETQFELICHGGGEKEYKIYISEVEIADSFDMPETLEGKVHDRMFVEIVPEDGVFEYEIFSDNPEVAITGFAGTDGFTVFFVGEGEANITVQSTFNETVKKTCKVTVDGELEQQILQDSTSVGLAAGNSISYDYHASQDGLYWILNDKPAFEISVTDSNGTNVVQYVFNATMQDCYGVVVSLSENEMYELTVENTANEALYTPLEIMYVEEAYGVRAPEHEERDREGNKGKSMFLPYELYAEEGDQLVVSNTIEVTSSDTGVATIGEKEYDGVWVNLVATGETTIAIELNDTIVTYRVTVRDFAMDFTLNNGDALTGVEASVVTFPVTLIGGTEIGFREIWVENPENSEPIAEYHSCTEDSISIRFLNAGNAILHVDTTNDEMEHKTFMLTAIEYGTELVNWKGTQAADTDLSMKYTPEEDGWYFMHENNETGEAARLSEELEQTITWFDYDENGYWGRVFYLEGGETYEFMSRTWEERDYAFYIKEVTVPNSFTVTSSISGKINEQCNLEINFTGALGTKIETSDPRVVLIGGGDARSKQIFLVGAGTATITVTDFRGNKQTCTVTVSNEVMEPQEFDGWGEVGLAAGGSITYTYTAEENGLYWFYGRTDQPFAISVKDVNGYQVIASDEDNRTGSVFALTAGETYELTFSSTAQVVTSVGREMVREATGITLHETSFSGVEGETPEIRYQLTGNGEGNFVAPISAVSSNENVVKIVSVEKNFTRIELVGGGTATVTLKVGSESKLFTVTSTATPAVEIDEEFSVTLEPGESALYKFVPATDGTYVLSRNMQGDLFGLSMNYEEQSMWTSMSENKNGFIFYDLKAGEKYIFELNHPDFASGAATNTMKIEKTGAVSSMALSESSVQVMTGSEISIRNIFSSYLNMEDPVQWSLTDSTGNDVLENSNIEVYEANATDIVLYFPDAGTYTLTATCGTMTDSCVITIMEVQDATGVEIKADSEDLPMFTMTNVTITPTPANGDLSDYTVTISDPDVVEVSSSRADEFTLFGRGEGTATVTITLKNGVTDSFDITVFKYDPITLNYEYEFEFNRWEGVGYGFTPDSDCGYRVEMTSDNLAMVHVRNPLIGYEEILEVSGGTDSMILDVEAGTYYVIDMTNQYSDAVAKGSVILVPDHALTKHEANAATCTQDGNIEYYTCDDCGKYYADDVGMLEITANATVVPADHKLDKVAAKAATCTTDGNIEHYKCSVCHNLYEDVEGKTLTDEESVKIKADHQYVLFDAKAATCTEDGNIDYFECSVCHKYFDGNKNETPLEELIIKASHALSKVEAKAATCTVDGNIEHYKCSVCEKLYDDAEASNELSEEDVIVEAAHTLSKVAAKAATCTVDGNIEHYKCSVCEKLYDDANASNELSEEDVIVEAAHTLSKVAAKAATCTIDGNIEHYKCNVCEKLYDDANASNELSEEDVVVEAGHKLSKVAAVAATCTTTGKIQHYTCEKCNKIFADADGLAETTSEYLIVAKTNHKLTKVNEMAATCTATGTKEHYTCSTCKQLFADASGKTVVTAEGLAIAPSHTISKIDAVAATCTATGTKEHYTCDGCKKLYADASGTTELTAADVLIAASHTLTKVDTVEATCTTAGVAEHYVCGACGKLYTDANATTEVTAADVVIASAHNIKKVDAVEADYTKPGNVEHYSCDACGKLFSDAEGTSVITDVATPQLVKVEGAVADITQDVIDKAVADAEETGEVNIDLTEVKEVSQIELPAKALKELAEAESSLTISTPQATVTFDSKTLETIASAAGEGTINLKIEQVETKTLNKKQKQAIADIEKDGVAVLVAISANLYSGDEYIGGDFNGGKAEVKVPLKLDEGENGEEYSVLYVDDNGKMWPVECSYKNGHLHFITGHFSEYVIVKAESTELTSPEADKELDNDSEKNTFGKEIVFGIVIVIVMCAVIGVVVSKKRKNGKQQK